MSSVHSKSSMLDIASDLIELASNYADQVLRTSSKSPPPEHVDSEKSNPRIPVGPPSMGRRPETPTTDAQRGAELRNASGIIVRDRRETTEGGRLGSIKGSIKGSLNNLGSF